jgi:hypothetical protein
LHSWEREKSISFVDENLVPRVNSLPTGGITLGDWPWQIMP